MRGFKTETKVLRILCGCVCLLFVYARVLFLFFFLSFVLSSIGKSLDGAECIWYTGIPLRVVVALSHDTSPYDIDF